MEEKHKEKIEKIKSKMSCSKNFCCVAPSTKELCKGKDFGLENYIDCSEENPGHCCFSIPFGYGYMCICPLRVYIAKELKK